jgi:hypothetical protein
MQPNLIESLLMILEKPNIKKGYKDFKKYLEFVGKTDEAKAIDLLLKKKFNEVNNSNSNQE